MSEAHRRVWAAHVAKLVYPHDPARAVKMIVDYLLGTSLAKLPIEAFTPASAEAVAEFPRRMSLPSFDEISKPLSAWWRDNRPNRFASLPAPMPPDRMPPTPEEIAHVSAVVAEFVGERSKQRAQRPADVRPAYLSREVINAMRAGVAQ